MAVIFAEPGGDATGGLQFYLGSVGTVTVTTNQPRTGARSIEFATGAGGAEAHCYKDAVLADAGRRVSFSYRFDTLPGTLATMWEAFAAGPAPVFWLNLTSDGLLQLATTGLSIDGTTVLSTSRTYHLAVCYTITSTTVNEFRVYLNGILEITWSNQTLPTTVTSLAMWGFFGAGGVGTSRTAWIDDVYIDDSSALTYPGDIKVTNKKPAAAGAANAFDTGIGAGTNRWDRVNEVPISETNGWQHAGSGSTSEQYTLQTAAVGEVDITDQEILANTSWLWGKEGASGTGTGEAIWRNGTAVGIALATTSALYTSIADAGSYPSGTQACGMRSSGGTRDVFLYECGMLVAYRPRDRAEFGLRPAGMRGHRQMHQLLSR